MAKFSRQLTPGTPAINFAAGTRITKIYVSNPTGSPVYIKVGSVGAPDENTATTTIPANSKEVLPALGVEFAAAFANPSLLLTSTSGNLGKVCTIWFLDDDEETPTFGSAQFLSLSLSELVAGDQPYVSATVSPIFDLSPWGGLIFSITPTVGVDQGIVQLRVSEDAVNFTVIRTWSLWPGVNLIISVPRTYRYVQLRFVIALGSTFSGVYTARATMSEILQLSYSASGTSISNAYNVPNLNEQSFMYATQGIPQVAIALANTSGNALQMIVETSSDAIAWRFVWQREQNVGSLLYRTIFRTQGNLNNYLRIRILEIGNNGPVVGTLALSIPGEADNNLLLSQILTALGDIGSPTSVNQDIYHELDTIRINSSDIRTNTSNIIINQNSQITLQTAANVAITSGNTLLAAGNVTTTNMLTVLNNMYNTSKASSFYYFATVVTGVGGVYVADPVNVWGPRGGGYLQMVSCLIDQTIGARAANNVVSLAYGTNAAPVAVMYTNHEVGPNIAGSTAVQLPIKVFDGPMRSGQLIPNGMTYTWVICTLSANVQVSFEVWYRDAAP